MITREQIIRQIEAKLQILLEAEPLSPRWKRAENTLVNILENYRTGLTNKDKKRYWDVYYKIGVPQ